LRTDGAEVGRSEGLPGVRQVRVEAGTVILRTGDSDAALRALFTPSGAFDD
jgi:hypothetical protein